MLLDCLTGDALSGGTDFCGGFQRQHSTEPQLKRRSSQPSGGLPQPARGRRHSWQGCRHVAQATKTVRRCQPEPEQPAEDDRKRFLLRYASSVTPDLCSVFEEHAPAHVTEAMKETVAKMLGTLPETFFDVSVTAHRAQDLAQLCSSVMMTGYLFRNVQQRLDLQQQMGELTGQEALASEVLAGCRQERQYAEGSQKDQVAGQVLRWRHDGGLQAIPASDYIASLEQQVAALRQQVARDLYVRAKANPILAYLRCQEAAHLASMTNTAREDTYEAVNSVVQSVVTASDAGQGSARTLPAGELASLLYWLGCVGYHLRTLETRWDIEQSLMLPV